MSRIDRERHQIVPIDVGGEPTALAFGAGSLWVANGESRTVAQVDPGSNRVVQRLEVGNASRGVAAGFGALWVTSAVDGVVRRIDLDAPPRSAARSTSAPTRRRSPRAPARSGWRARRPAPSPASTRGPERSVQAIPVGNGPSAVAVGEGAVWAVNRPDGDGLADRPAHEQRCPGRSPSAPTRRRSRPATAACGSPAAAPGTVVAHRPRRPAACSSAHRVGSSASAVAIAGGEVWASAVAPPASHRGGTLRVITSVSRPAGAVPIDWLDPEAYAVRACQLMSLAYDGLVAYRRTAGAAGATLVGALATDVPEPSPDGRTYVFTLRPGLRFSDGRPVRPEDFRASIERFLQVTRKKPFPRRSTRASSAPSGASTGAARCDLSAGIEADPRARTITVHLTRPDAEFLHKLAFPFAYVVPRDTPRRRPAIARRPAPGPTGSPPGTRERGGTWSATRTSGRGPRRTAPPASPTASRSRRRFAGRSRRRRSPEGRRDPRGAADLTVLADPFGSRLPAEHARGARDPLARAAPQPPRAGPQPHVPQRAQAAVRRRRRAPRAELRH